MGLRVLIGGEFTGVLRDAFCSHGHYAMSCDFKKSLRPGPHYQGDWKDIEGDGWDLAIFHRTCTKMANSGAKHLYRGMKKEHGIDEGRFIDCLRDAWGMWDHMENCPIQYVAWENPVMVGYAQLIVGKPMQTVQPWWFGTDEKGPDNVKKATCFWSETLPKLKRTGTLDGSTARDEVFRMAPTKDPEERRMARSEFKPGMAAACAEQWGAYVMKQLAKRPGEAAA